MRMEEEEGEASLHINSVSAEDDALYGVIISNLQEALKSESRVLVESRHPAMHVLWNVNFPPSLPCCVELSLKF